MGLKFSGGRVTQVTANDFAPSDARRGGALPLVKGRQRGATVAKGKPGKGTRVPLAKDVGTATVVALDPGGTTGWAVFVVSPECLSDPEVTILSSIQHWSCGEITGDEHTQCQEAIELLDAWPTATVVIEDFILRQFNKGRELLSPVRITAVLSFWLAENGRDWYRQQPSMAKTAMTDERLQRVGLYRPGDPHATDAIRHALTFLRRAKSQEKMREEAWPGLF